MPIRVIKIDSKWDLLAADSEGPEKLKNAAFFAKYPNTVLARKKRSVKYHNNEFTHLVCAEPNCGHAISRPGAERSGIMHCFYHAFPMYEGVRIRKQYVIDLLPLLVKMEPTSNYEYKYYIKCQTPLCERLIDVSLPGPAKRRHCVPCQYRRRADEALREQYEELSKQYNIIGYALKKVSHTDYPWQRLPRIVCLEKGCKEHATLRSDHISTGLCKHHARYRDEPYRWAFNALKAGALKRKIPFNLTFEGYTQIITKTPHCFYCDTLVTVEKCKPTNSTERKLAGLPTLFTGHGIDRKDSTTGYSLKNCVTCCAFHNVMKSDLLSADMLRLQALAANGREEEAITHLQESIGRMVRDNKKIFAAWLKRRERAYARMRKSKVTKDDVS